jgi:hypothetical protein
VHIKDFDGVLARHCLEAVHETRSRRAQPDEIEQLALPQVAQEPERRVAG